MHRNSANDDLALSEQPYDVIAIIPVLGRLPLLKYTIRRLYHKNGCHKVICVGHRKEDSELCEMEGAVWIQHDNYPLGAKWNAGFKEAKKFKPDACLYVGSSDWICDDWIPIMKPYIEKYQITGTSGCYFVDLSDKIRLVNWKGYVGGRANETIGIGRLLSRKLLDRINWQPFQSELRSSLDGSMKKICAGLGLTDNMVKDERLISLSISSDKWQSFEQNLHKFEQHWNNFLPSERLFDPETFLKINFPEALQVHEDLTRVRV